MTALSDEKEYALRQELQECEEAHGSEDLRMVLPLSRMAQHLKRKGRASETIDLYRRGLSILERQYGADDVSVALFAGYLAAAYAALGEEAEAAALLHKATGILDLFAEQDPVGVASSFCLIGDDFLQAGREDEAALLLTVALRSLPGEADDDTRWRIWFSLSRLFSKKQNTAAAIASAKRSVNTLQRMRKKIAAQSMDGMRVFTDDVGPIYAWLGNLLTDALRSAELQEVEALRQEETSFDVMKLSEEERSGLESFFARKTAGK